MHLIGNRFRWVVSLSAVVVVAPLAHAQHHRLAPGDVVQIAGQALRVVIPPEADLSGVTVAKRGIAFDMRRSLAAFRASTTDPLPRLSREVTLASQSVLRDCSQAEQRPCAALGSRVYAFIEPKSVTSSHAVVRVNVLWADRVHFGDDASRSGDGYLTGSTHTLYFARRADGRWAFERKDPSVITS